MPAYLGDDPSPVAVAEDCHSLADVRHVPFHRERRQRACEREAHQVQSLRPLARAELQDRVVQQRRAHGRVRHSLDHVSVRVQPASVPNAHDETRAGALPGHDHGKLVLRARETSVPLAERLVQVRAELPHAPPERLAGGLPVDGRALRRGHRQERYQQPPQETAGAPLPLLEASDHLTTIWPAFASILASTDWISAKPCELCGFRPLDASIELSASL